MDFYNYSLITEVLNLKMKYKQKYCFCLTFFFSFYKLKYIVYLCVRHKKTLILLKILKELILNIFNVDFFKCFNNL